MSNHRYREKVDQRSIPLRKFIQWNLWIHKDRILCFRQYRIWKIGRNSLVFLGTFRRSVILLTQREDWCHSYWKYSCHYISSNWSERDRVTSTSGTVKRRSLGCWRNIGFSRGRVPFIELWLDKIYISHFLDDNLGYTEAVSWSLILHVDVEGRMCSMKTILKMYELISVIQLPPANLHS